MGRQKLLHLRSDISGSKPSVGVLSDGEIAINTRNEKLFFKTADGEIAEIDSVKNTQKAIENTINSKVFIGTQEEYDIAYAEGKIGMGALVIILDENEANSDATTAMLGKAIIGTLLLGRA